MNPFLRLSPLLISVFNLILPICLSESSVLLSAFFFLFLRLLNVAAHFCLTLLHRKTQGQTRDKRNTKTNHMYSRHTKHKDKSWTKYSIHLQQTTYCVQKRTNTGTNRWTEHFKNSASSVDLFCFVRLKWPKLVTIMLLPLLCF